MMDEFSLPVSLQELEVEQEHATEELVNGGLLAECIECLSGAQGSFSMESCFSVYIHLLRRWSKISESVRVQYWTCLAQGFVGLCVELGEQELHTLPPDVKQATRSKIKMMAYLMVQWLEASENSCSATGKKQTIPSGWKAGRETCIECMGVLMELPLASLWDPPSPSMMDDLSGLVATGCYKLLESPIGSRERALTDKTVRLLGKLVRDYGQALSFCLKVSQLLHNFDHLVSTLSGAVVTLATDYGAKSIVPDIIREIASKDPKDLSVDASGTRCFAGFLVEVAGAMPELVLPVISVLVPHLTGESYTFRNGVLGVIGHLLLHLSQGQGSLTNNPRDSLLSKLMEHAYDTNAFVRVKVVQTLDTLVSSKAIPLHSLQEMLELVCGRLSDKSSSVRKGSLHLLTSTLTCNPFSAKLELEMFQTKLISEQSTLEGLVSGGVASGGVVLGDEDDQENRELAKQLAVVNYLQNAVLFVEVICRHIPLVVQMMSSKVTSDILEAINFLSKCASFGIPAARVGVQRSLGLVWSGDAAIRKAVLDVHIQLYLDPGEEGSGGRVMGVANNLVAMVRSSSRGQLASLERLLGMLVEGDYITAPVIKCLWDIFQQSSADSALAVQVLSMIGSVSRDVINNNFDLLVRIGVSGQDDRRDVILAQQTCSALSKMATSCLPSGKLLPIDHPLLSQLRALLLQCLSDVTTSHWAGLAEAVVVCVFKLCVSPILLCEELLHTLTSAACPPESTTINSVVLGRLLFAVGTVAHRLMLFMETIVSRELKTRASKDLDKQPLSKDGDELALAGASGDDPVIELVKRVLEGEVGGAPGLLATFEPLIVEVLVNPTKYQSADLSNSAALTLAKLMLISPCVCERYLRLFFTVLEKSDADSVRANGVIMASDLACRFPNLIEPWTPHLYARLSDVSCRVRRNTMTVLTHLILNDMVKVRGQISAIALAIEDSDPKIADLAKHFFHELASKGNTLYNVIPDIVSSLSGSDPPTPHDTFNNIIRYIFSLIQKDKQCESLVEKLCHRFRAARSERQARDLAHCICQLSVTEKSLRRLYDNLPAYKDWLVEDSVYQAFTTLLNKAKKSSKPEVKGQIDDLEKLFKDAHEKGLYETTPSKVPPTANETPPDDGETPPEASVMSHDVVSGGEDDFSRDVLFSARRSLARGTPYLEGVRGQTRGTPYLEGVRGRSSIQNNRPLKFELDLSDED